MLDTHGKDLTVTGTPGTTTPGTPAPAVSNSPLSNPVSAKEVTKGITNATTVTVDASFMASAADLFELLTDEKKIPAWSHAPAQVSIIRTPWYHCLMVMAFSRKLL
jgi:activator of HSP90 ATPase